MPASPRSFKSSCIKTLSAVEARPERSNQHELNGVQELKHLFGIPRFSGDAIFSVMGSDITTKAGVTWYDAREAHPTRTEHRFYFKSNSVMDLAEEGDNIMLAFDRADDLHCILIKRGSAEHTGLVKNWTTVSA